MRLRSKLNKILGLMVLKQSEQKVFITTLLHCQQNFALWKFRSCKFSRWRNFATANFRFVEISQLRIFAPTKFRQNEISLQWMRNFAKMTAKFRLTRRKFVAKFRRIFARTKNEKHRIRLHFFCIVLYTVPLKSKLD